MTNKVKKEFTTYLKKYIKQNKDSIQLTDDFCLLDNKSLNIALNYYFGAIDNLIFDINRKQTKVKNKYKKSEKLNLI